MFKKLKVLPDVLSPLVPTVVDTKNALHSALRSIGVRPSTVITALPSSSGITVALCYGRDFDFQSATVLSLERPYRLADHIRAFRIPTRLNYHSGLHLQEALGIDHADNIWVTAQVCLPRSNYPIIAEKRPKVKGVNALTLSYLTDNDRPNLMLASVLSLYATDVFAEHEGVLRRLQIPALSLEQHLTSLGFRAFNTHSGAKCQLLTAADYVTKLVALNKGADANPFAKFNSDIALTGLRLMTNSPSDASSVLNLSWKTIS